MPCATLKTPQNLPRVCIHAKLTAPSWLGLGPEAKCWSSALKAQKACGAKSSAFQSATVDDRTLRASAGPQRLWLQSFSQDLRPGKGQHPTSFSAPTPQMRRIRLPTLLPMVSGSDCTNYAKLCETMRNITKRCLKGPASGGNSRKSKCKACVNQYQAQTRNRNHSISLDRLDGRSEPPRALLAKMPEIVRSAMSPP